MIQLIASEARTILYTACIQVHPYARYGALADRSSHANKKLIFWPVSLQGFPHGVQFENANFESFHPLPDGHIH